MTAALVQELAAAQEQAELLGDRDTARLLERAAARVAELEADAQWRPVSKEMPKSGQIVLACYTNRAGMVRRIRAEWIAAKSKEADSDSDIAEYDEATDAYYDPEGWYERIDNWGDYSAVTVTEGEVTYWRPLPAPPQEQTP